MLDAALVVRRDLLSSVWVLNPHIVMSMYVIWVIACAEETYTVVILTGSNPVSALHGQITSLFPPSLVLLLGTFIPMRVLAVCLCVCDCQCVCVFVRHV